MEEKTITRKDIFKGKIIDLHVDEISLQNEKTSIREVVEHKGAACIAALTPENDLLFVKQYRYPFKEVLLELPAGKLDGDEPLECAKRELLEETGAIGENFVSLGKIYPAPAFCSEVVYLYACTVREFRNPKPDDDEFLEMVKIPLPHAVKMVLNGQIDDAKTQTAILKFFLKIKELYK